MTRRKNGINGKENVEVHFSDLNLVENEAQNPPPPTLQSSPRQKFVRYWLPIGLQLYAVFSAILAGAYQLNTQPVSGVFEFLGTYPSHLLYGVPFAITLLFILFIHRYTHYILLRYHRIPSVALPFILPMPPQFLGATSGFLRIHSSIVNRKAFFDIWVSGSVAGMFAAFIGLTIGLFLSEVTPREYTFGVNLGESLLFQFLGWLIFGSIPEGFDIVLHPVGFASWAGMFAVSIFLLPMGRLDGKYIIYSLFGRDWQRVITTMTILILIFLGFFGEWAGWVLLPFGALILNLRSIFRGRPEIIQDLQGELGTGRVLIAVGVVVIFIITFMPVPIYLGGGPP